MSVCCWNARRLLQFLNARDCVGITSKTSRDSEVVAFILNSCCALVFVVCSNRQGSMALVGICIVMCVRCGLHSSGLGKETHVFVVLVFCSGGLHRNGARKLDAGCRGLEHHCDGSGSEITTGDNGPCEQKHDDTGPGRCNASLCFH